MFYLLCITLCFVAMFVVTAATTLASASLLPLVLARTGRRPAVAANLIFILRILPALLGLIVAAGLVLPAFLEFEPSATGEIPGVPLVLLAALGGLMLSVTLVRCWQILRTTFAMQRKWLQEAECLGLHQDRVPVYCVNQSSALMAVTGLFRPQIFVSRDVACVLNRSELDAALAHELSHVSTGDNLKQLLLKITRPPSWVPFLGRLDSAWANNSEIAADEGAIMRGSSALDLSSALIKVGRLSTHHESRVGLAASHLVDGCGSATQVRAARLRELLEGNSGLAGSDAGRGVYTPLIFSAVILLYLALLSSLPAIHELLEFLVR